MFRTEGGVLETAEVDGEPGGGFVIIENRRGQKAEHYGTFVEIERPEKLTFVFSVEKDSADSDYIEIQFTRKVGGAEVTIHHELKEEYLPMAERIKGGWKQILENLETYLTKKQAAASLSQPKDSQGQILAEGDSVKTIKDLKVKGSSMVIKRGTVVKKIHLVQGNDEEVDCKVDGVALALETQWLVKV